MTPSERPCPYGVLMRSLRQLRLQPCGTASAALPRVPRSTGPAPPRTTAACPGAGGVRGATVCPAGAQACPVRLAQRGRWATERTHDLPAASRTSGWLRLVKRPVALLTKFGSDGRRVSQGRG